MSKGICDKVSNNKYFDCPARMDDGRQFTDYRSSDYVNNVIRMSSGTMSSYDYRQYLIHNADKIMQENRSHAKEKNNCSPCNSQPVPFLRECNSTLVNTECNVLNKDGIGTRYGSALR